MVFSSIVFLCIFFPAVIILYYICPHFFAKPAILCMGRAEVHSHYAVFHSF